MNPISKLLTENNIYPLAEAAKRLGVKENTLQHRIYRGGFEYPILKIGGAWLIKLGKPANAAPKYEPRSYPSTIERYQKLGVKLAEKYRKKDE
jgi:hypothetical protein